MIIKGIIVVDGVQYDRYYSDVGYSLANEQGALLDEAIVPAGTQISIVETSIVGSGIVSRYSRWGVIKAIEKRGLADLFDEYLKNDNRAFRSFYGPEWFEASDARFQEMVKTIQRLFELTDEQVAEILSESLYDEN